MSLLKWYYAASLDDFGTNVCLSVEVMTHAILLVQQQGELYAYANNCPHENLPLTGCTIEHQEIICPHHGARFSVLTGQVLAPPAFENLETYPIKIEHQRIYIGINDAF